MLEPERYLKMLRVEHVHGFFLERVSIPWRWMMGKFLPQPENEKKKQKLRNATDEEMISAWLKIVTEEYGKHKSTLYSSTASFQLAHQQREHNNRDGT